MFHPFSAQLYESTVPISIPCRARFHALKRLYRAYSSFLMHHGGREMKCKWAAKIASLQRRPGEARRVPELYGPDPRYMAPGGRFAVCQRSPN